MRTPPPQPWVPVTRPEITRAIAIAVIAFVVVCAAALAGLEPLVTGTRALRIARIVLGSLGAACVAAGLACFLVALPLNRRLRESSRHDVWLLRRLSRVVLEGKHQELRAGDEVDAVAYAVAMTVLLPFRLGYVALVFVGLWLEEVQLILAGGLTTPTGVIAVLFVLVGLSAVLTQHRQLQRARAYAHQNASLLSRA